MTPPASRHHRRRFDPGAGRRELHGDLCARIIKVETFDRGDDICGWRTRFIENSATEHAAPDEPISSAADHTELTLTR